MTSSLQKAPHNISRYCSIAIHLDMCTRFMVTCLLCLLVSIVSYKWHLTLLDCACDPLVGQQITERLRDPRGIRKNGPQGGTVRNNDANGPHQRNNGPRGVIRRVRNGHGQCMTVKDSEVFLHRCTCIYHRLVPIFP